MNVYEIKRWSHHYRIALTVLTPTPVTVAVSAKMIDRSCCIPHVYVRDAFNSWSGPGHSLHEFFSVKVSRVRVRVSVWTEWQRDIDTRHCDLADLYLFWLVAATANCVATRRTHCHSVQMEWGQKTSLQRALLVRYWTLRARRKRPSSLGPIASRTTINAMHSRYYSSYLWLFFWPGAAERKK